MSLPHYIATFLPTSNETFAWTDFQKWWKQVTGNKIDLNYKSIVFGVNPQNPDTSLNLSIIIIKRMIYICKFSTIKVPSITV